MSKNIINSIISQAETRIEELTGVTGSLTFTPKNLNFQASPFEQTFQQCCQAFNVSAVYIKMRSRNAELVAMRQATAYVLKECHPAVKYKMIADLLGLSDHSSVIHCINQAVIHINNRDVFFLKYFTQIQHLLK